MIEVGGASPAAYNGEHRVKKVSSTEVWFELDGGNPGSAASGAMSMKVAPLGWTLTHESADGMVAIYPADRCQRLWQCQPAHRQHCIQRLDE